MKLQMKLLVIGLALLAIMLTLYYNSGSFRDSSSEPRYPKRVADERRSRRREKVNTPRRRRPSSEEVEEVYEKKFLSLPRFKRSAYSEDDYKDDRLSRDYASRERQFELPSEKEYTSSSTRPYNIGSTCNNSYQMRTDGRADDYDGFSTFE
jgi:hypothetical protein